MRDPFDSPDDGPRVYRIIRYYRSGRRRTLRNGVTLLVAQLHCRDPKTKKDGVYFDGYDFIRGYKRHRSEADLENQATLRGFNRQ